MSDETLDFEQDEEWFDQDGWASFPHRAARDGGADGLSWEARGMLVYLRSHAPTWRTRMKDLEREGNCGRERTRRILGELIDAGYVVRTRKQVTPGGPVEWLYRTRPRRSARSTGHPTVGKPVDRKTRPSDEPTVGEPVDIEKTNSSEHQTQEQENFSSPVADATPDKAKPSTKPEAPRDDVDQVCARLRDRIAANGVKTPEITEAWRRDARLMLDRDGRELRVTLRLIDWVQADPFWAPNVMSMAKFRKQYDQLRLKARAEEQKRKAAPVSPTSRAVAATDAAWAEWETRNTGRPTNGHPVPALTGGGRA